MLAAAAQPALAAGEYPVREVLAAFATACSAVDDTAANAAGALAVGWERLPPDSDELVSRVARQGRRALEDDNSGVTTIPGSEYRKQVGGRTLYLAISGALLDGATARGCRVYDFTAPRAPTVEELEDWAGRPPEDPQTHRGAINYTWQPGLKPSHSDMQAIYVTPGSRPVPGFDIGGGLALIASALEF